MTRPLYSKFILGYLIFGLSGFITITTFSPKMTRGYLVRYQADVMYDEADIIVSSCSTMYQGERLDSGEVTSQTRAPSKYLRAEIWVVNRQGAVVMNSQGSLRVQTTIANFDPTTMGNRPHFMGNYYGLLKEGVLGVSAPITGDYNTYGYVLVHLPLSRIAQSQNNILDILYITSAIVFVLSLIILLIFAQTVYLPLCKITYGANEYVTGSLGYRIEVEAHGEVGYLANTLSYISDELNKMEGYQKNFIASVSHGYRSPLASIKGYLETILDDTVPSKTYEKYTSRAVSETDRLHKLTESMSTLNSLDVKGYLSHTNLDINRVVKDTTASLEGTCDAKNINFELTFSDNIQMVFANLGKIQQALYNLVSDAIKFSHYNSIAYIQVSGRYERIFVSVKDMGVGTPKDSQKKIWERSYKTDLSRDKDKKDTGLGLSIMKEIVQSREGNIDMVGTEGVDTESVFSLPRSTNL